MTTGDVIYIIEQDYGYQPMYRAMGMSNVSMDLRVAMNPTPDVEFEKIKVQYKILARFEIK
ncbi:MAG: hypothetical protein R2777_09910 [Chitinophagales bacterium]